MTDEQNNAEETERDATAAYAALMGTGEPETPDDTRQHNDNDALTALLGNQ